MFSFRFLRSSAFFIPRIPRPFLSFFQHALRFRWVLSLSLSPLAMEEVDDSDESQVTLQKAQACSRRAARSVIPLKAASPIKSVPICTGVYISSMSISSFALISPQAVWAQKWHRRRVLIYRRQRQQRRRLGRKYSFRVSGKPEKGDLLWPTSDGETHIIHRILSTFPGQRWRLLVSRRKRTVVTSLRISRKRYVFVVETAASFLRYSFRLHNIVSLAMVVVPI